MAQGKHPIMDFKGLNRHIKYSKFCMICMISLKAWMASTDLQDVYFHLLGLNIANFYASQWGLTTINTEFSPSDS